MQQTNPEPIIAIDIIPEPELNTCVCPRCNRDTCVCTDCKCHLRREIDYIIIPMPPPRIQLCGYCVIVAIVTIIGLYMLILSPKP